MHRFLLACAMLILSLVASGGAAAAEPIRVAAAADLKFALDAVIQQYQGKHPDSPVQATYGSSGTLFAQIENGAPFDLFLSADAKLPARLIESDSAVQGSAFIYAIGHLVLWVAKDSNLEIETRGLEALKNPVVGKIAVANPELAPYGAAAVAALRKAGLYEVLKERLVLGENVGQAAQFAESGAADAALISKSLALSPKMKGSGRLSEIPPTLYDPLEQTGVLCTRGAHRAGAQALRDFLRGPEAREILVKYGFALPPESR